MICVDSRNKNGTNGRITDRTNESNTNGQLYKSCGGGERRNVTQVKEAISSQRGLHVSQRDNALKKNIHLVGVWEYINIKGNLIFPLYFLGFTILEKSIW